MLTTAPASPQPLYEIDRFFAAPRDRSGPNADAQSAALSRMIVGCERVRPHLISADALERYIRRQPDPNRVRRRISLALALETPSVDVAYGLLEHSALERFRILAQQQLPAIVWVFS